MKRRCSYPISLAGTCILAAASLAASVSVARADTWDKKTTVSFSQPVEVPGYILQPGKYVMKLVDSQSDRHVVQFTNERQNHVYATTIAVPAYRTQVTDRTVITFYEAAAGQPEPIRNWYYPGDNFGQEFVYPKEHLRDIAAVRPATPTFDAGPRVDSSPVAAAQPVPDAASAPVAGLTEPSAQDTSAQDNQAATVDAPSAPVEIAQATPPKPEEPAAAPPSAPARTAPAPTALPKTNGNFAGIALAGLLSIGGAVSARKLRRF
jgi:hypothetical protein